MLVVLKYFHAKDLKNYMYLDADPHLKTCCFREPPQQQRFECKMFTVKEYLKICTHFHDFSKTAGLQARSAALGAALWACRSAVFQ